MVVHAVTLGASERWWQKDQKFKVSLSQKSSVKPTCLKKCNPEIPTLPLAYQPLLNPKYGTHVKYWQAVFMCYSNRHKW